MARKTKKTRDKIRSWILVAAHNRGGAGAHGGTARQKNRRQRRSERQELRDTYDGS